MTKPNDDLRTNDEPQRILLEASARMKACYPNETKIEALIGGERVRGVIYYVGFVTPEFRSRERAFFRILCGKKETAFDPTIHPHKVLP